MKLIRASLLSFLVVTLAAVVLSCEKRSADAPDNGSAVAAPQAACPPSEKEGAPLAQMDGNPVTEADFDAKAKGILSKAKAEMYEEKKKALDLYLFDRLVQEEAGKKKISEEEYLKAELDGKVKKVSDGDVKTFYNKLSKDRGGQMPKLEQVAERIKQHLEQQGKEERREALFEDLKKKHKVAYLISRPRIQVGLGENPVKGAAKAPITIVEFSDFQCPFCKRAEVTVDEVMKLYRGKVKLYFRDMPLHFHKDAKPAALAARCAGEQGKFWEYHGKLFEKQQLGDENYRKYAQELKLDAAKFEACMSSQKFMASIEKDMEEGSGLGVTGTPAFFINGVMISGAQPLEAFKKVIDEELKVAKAGSKGSVLP